jgi:hypothetical protein
VIITAHPEFDIPMIVERSRLVLDLRGVTRGIEADHVTRL